MSNWLGAVVGAAIDRRDGDSGVKGAILGSLAEKTIRVAAPLALTFAIGWAVQRGARKAWRAWSDREAGPPRPDRSPLPRTRLYRARTAPTFVLSPSKDFLFLLLQGRKGLRQAQPERA